MRYPIASTIVGALNFSSRCHYRPTVGVGEKNIQESAATNVDTLAKPRRSTVGGPEDVSIISYCCNNIGIDKKKTARREKIVPLV